MINLGNFNSARKVIDDYFAKEFPPRYSINPDNPNMTKRALDSLFSEVFTQGVEPSTTYRPENIKTLEDEGTLHYDANDPRFEYGPMTAEELDSMLDLVPRMRTLRPEEVKVRTVTDGNYKGEVIIPEVSEGDIFSGRGYKTLDKKFKHFTE